MKTMHNRRSIRLKEYDYTQAGAYFVTICTHERRCLFGWVENSGMKLNTWGEIAQYEWERTAVVRPNVELDAFVVMPNHFHGIIIITDSVGATRRVAPTRHTLQSKSLGAIIGQFKSIVTKRIMKIPTASDYPIWQRNYHEHIIRNEQSLDHIRTYVAANPSLWADDSLYLA
jgi:REP element-mobilizing transposase RayT